MHIISSLLKKKSLPDLHSSQDSPSSLPFRELGEPLWEGQSWRQHSSFRGSTSWLSTLPPYSPRQDILHSNAYLRRSGLDWLISSLRSQLSGPLILLVAGTYCPSRSRIWRGVWSRQAAVSWYPKVLVPGCLSSRSSFISSQHSIHQVRTIINKTLKLN